MNSEVVVQKSALPAMAMSEADLIGVLSSSLYPGAANNSILMVLSYCKAAGLDPMQKPVHIVPMWDKNAKALRDVVMPGIGLYRTQAARSGNYAGVTEPEFGQDVTEDFGGISVTFPKWCKVTVKRAMSNGAIVEFTATEFWKENYATAGKDSISPNAMWKKRPYGQIAKCAEAQALRKAFPEFGSQPTADEMEGKMDEVDVTPRNQPVQSVKASLHEITPDELRELCADKVNDDGEIIKMGLKSLVQSGQKTSGAFIDWLSKKATITPEIKAIIESWESIKGETA